MQCPKCQHENRDDAKFCRGCGGRLARACRGCGSDLLPDSQFCDECGAPARSPDISSAPARDPRAYTPKHLADKILTSHSALEGERKQVTVLFADVKGSMELAEQLDPEEWHKILDRFFQILSEGVHRFEGTVNQYTGDGIMALFGAPIAHEDHAQRACYAALHLSDELRVCADELRREHGLNFSMRMGLNSGEVVVGKIGNDLRMDYTAQGHSVGLAARVEQLSAADRVSLTENTAKLVEGYVELRDLGPFTLEGVTDPIRVYELVGPGALGTRLAVSQARGFSRFVGRSSETQILETALESARDGHGQVVGIVGEAGVGKSRLCFEFAERCRARGISVYEAHCPAHGKTVPFLATLQLLRAYYGITDRDAPGEARRKVAGTLVLLDKRFHDSLPLIFDFLGIGDPDNPAPRLDGDARQRRLHAIVREVGRAFGERETSITFVDDLHWIDPGSDAYLAHLVEALVGTRSLLLVNFRPEYDAPWMQRSDYQQIALVPLGAEAIEELLGGLLGDDPSLAPVKDLIRERAGGNPFFVEELVQSLIEEESVSGERGAYRVVGAADQIAVPATVQSVLAARIDRLPASAKSVLQTAAVIGREFSEPILRKVCELTGEDLDDALGVLGHGEFIFVRVLYPETEYSFKHPLTQEVAYSSQLGDRRARIHADAARAIEEANPEKYDEHSALLAQHWEAAGNALEAARWHRRAGEWTALSDSAQSLRHWRRARELLRRVPESSRTNRWRATACSQLLNLIWRQGEQDKTEALNLFEEGTRCADGDPGMLALLHIGYATVLGTLGATDEWVDYCKRGLELAERSGSDVLQLVVMATLAPALATRGDYRECVDVADRGMALAQGNLELGAELMNFSPYLLLLGGSSLSRVLLGEVVEGGNRLRQCLHLAQERDDLLIQAWTHGWLAQWGYYAGVTTGAMAHGRAAVEAAERLASAAVQVPAYWSLGLAAMLEGDLAEAGRALERAREVNRESWHGPNYEAATQAALGETYQLLGDTEKAIATIGETSTDGGRSVEHITEPEAFVQLARARILIRGGRVEERATIEAALTHVHELVTDADLRVFLPLIVLERAHLAELLGDDAERERRLHEALQLFSEMGATGYAERLAKEIGG